MLFLMTINCTLYVSFTYVKNYMSCTYVKLYSTSMRRYSTSWRLFCGGGGIYVSFGL